MFSVHEVLKIQPGSYVRKVSQEEGLFHFNHYYTLSNKKRRCNCQEMDQIKDTRIVELLAKFT
jgi:hypothetical protein